MVALNLVLEFLPVARPERRRVAVDEPHHALQPPLGVVVLVLAPGVVVDPGLDEGLQRELDAVGLGGHAGEVQRAEEKGKAAGEASARGQGAPASAESPKTGGTDGSRAGRGRAGKAGARCARSRREPARAFRQAARAPSQARAGAAVWIEIASSFHLATATARPVPPFDGPRRAQMSLRLDLVAPRAARLVLRAVGRAALRERALMVVLSRTHARAN